VVKLSLPAAGVKAIGRVNGAGSAVPLSEWTRCVNRMDKQGNPAILGLSADLLMGGTHSTGTRGSIINIPVTAMPANINLYQVAMIYLPSEKSMSATIAQTRFRQYTLSCCQSAGLNPFGRWRFSVDSLFSATSAFTPRASTFEKPAAKLYGEYGASSTSIYTTAERQEGYLSLEDLLAEKCKDEQVQAAIRVYRHH
jgi:hypothetical protein